MKPHKLSNAQRNEIARRFAAGEKGIALAAEFGVSAGNVSCLAQKRGKKRPKRVRLIKRTVARPTHEMWLIKKMRLLREGKILGYIPGI